MKDYNFIAIRFGFVMRNRRKSSFTLIEVMVCLVILSIAGSFLVYKGAGMLRENRFSTSCEKLSSEIALTKGLAINYQMDIDIILEQKGGKIYLTRKTDVAPLAIKSLFQSPVVLPEVAFGKGDGIKEIHCYGNGWIEGDETLTLFMASHREKQYSIGIKHSFRKAV